MSRRILIICEESYAQSIWGKQILSGLTSELKKKRLNYWQSFQIEDIEAGDTICLIGTIQRWLSQAIRFCNSMRIVPVVMCNQSGRAVSGQYHCVCADTYGLMKQICDHFFLSEKKKLALYGVNPASVSDVSRMECFLELLPDRRDVFHNNGSLEKCFRSFLPCAKQYDAVICVNSYAAISLVRKLEAVCPEILGSISIVSYAETQLSSYYNKWISFIDLNLGQYGKAALTIFDIIENSTCFSAITITISGTFPHVPHDTSLPELSKEAIAHDSFYEDSELIYMSRIEHLLNECSDLDKRMLSMLLQNATYSEIAESCFLSERAVKYHIKKYMEICSVNTKQELLTLLKEYL